MAELTLEERLQPSLLDRLMDDAPERQQESRDERVLSLSRFRDGVIRDLTWLLNTVYLQAFQALQQYPYVMQSVLNYGTPELSGITSTSIDPQHLEQAIKMAICHFEPRIIAQSLKVKVNVNQHKMNHNTVIFEIEGTLWAIPLPLELFLRTELDLETGHVQVLDQYQS